MDPELVNLGMRSLGIDGVISLPHPQFTQRMQTYDDPSSLFSRPPNPEAESKLKGAASTPSSPEERMTGFALPVAWGVAEVRTFYLDPGVEGLDRAYDAEQRTLGQPLTGTAGWFSDQFSEILEEQHRWAQDDGMLEAGLVARYFGQERTSEATAGRYVEILVFKSEADRIRYRHPNYEQIQYNRGHLLQDRRSMVEGPGSTVEIFDAFVAMTKN
jgi:hypothetical protein